MDVLGYVIGVTTLFFAFASWWDSKSIVLKRLDRKKAKLRSLEEERFRANGMNGRSIGPITSLDRRISKLNEDIAELQRKL